MQHKYDHFICVVLPKVAKASTELSLSLSISQIKLNQCQYCLNI
jgi:hypothetical protein